VVSEYQEPDDSLSYDNELLHTKMRLTGTGDDGTPVDVEGAVSTICPTKVPMRGGAENARTFYAQKMIMLPR
jgi:hypothetical protein